MSEGKKTATGAESKPKLQLDGKFVLRITGTLLGICAVVALLLGTVNHFTKPIITANEAEATAHAMAQVLEADTYEPVEQSFGEGVTSVSRAITDGETVGFVVEVQSSGFGVINSVVGVDLDGAVTGVAVIKHGETPNVGTKVVDDQSVLDRFIGMSRENGEITVNAGANRFDGVSGATVSSKGVTAGVNAALRAVEACKGGM